MIVNNIEQKIKDLFLKKKYEKVIEISEEYTTPYRRPSSLANLIGVSKMFKSDLTENDANSALECFVETYLTDKKGKHGLNGIFHLITISLQLYKKYTSVHKYIILSKKYYMEAEKNFQNNDNFLSAGFLLFKFLLDHNKLKIIINHILSSNSQSKILRSSCLIFNNYFYDWSQENHNRQAKINSKYFLKLNSNKINIKKFDQNRINLGFVSADFNFNHSTTFFIKNTIKYIDKKKYKIFIFSFAKHKDQDKSQIELKKLSDQWFDLDNKQNQEVINLIQENKIKILFDLMGFTCPERIEIFNTRISPIQISWLAYCNTIGFETIDYIIADKNLIYKEEEKLYSEKIIKLPEIWNAHSGFDYPRMYNKLPSLNSEVFTFGSLNNFQKISTETLEVWAQILKKSQKFKLILKSSELCDYTQIFNFFKQNNLDSQVKFLDKKNFKNKKDHLDIYKKIDLGLDTFPYNGVTTTFEALWMNVPVLVLKGYNFNSRCGESIMKNCKLNFLIASNKEDYIEKAYYLARNKKIIEEYRLNLFENVISSPLFNTKKFSKNFSDALLKL
jgi:predicted O-linked N-acetylglucosamine transferase (SPINDLY family)